MTHCACLCHFIFHFVPARACVHAPFVVWVRCFGLLLVFLLFPPHPTTTSLSPTNVFIPISFLLACLVSFPFLFCCRHIIFRLFKCFCSLSLALCLALVVLIRCVCMLVFSELFSISCDLLLRRYFPLSPFPHKFNTTRSRACAFLLAIYNCLQLIAPCVWGEWYS